MFKFNDKLTVDIRPTTSIYSTYSRLSYTLWHAIAEFVDNSTASYFENESVLKEIENNYKLKVIILYHKDNKNKENHYLKIIDNAYGMNLENFKRALQINKPPQNTNGRNEFGMGLKTSACWFGKEWDLVSTMYGDKNEYSTNLNVENLLNENHVDINKKHVDKNAHYSILTIRKLNKFIITARQEIKIKEQISSIYRRELNYKNIEIKFVTSYYDKDNILVYTDGKNNFKNYEDIESLTYELPKILVIKNNVTGIEERFYKEFNEEIDFNNVKYNLSGFIAIRDKFSRQESGFSLIRRGRVIIGGPDTNYRPKDIFGDAGTFTHGRLFGEINLDNWPVSQAKDAFDWNDGLEDVFINKMKKISSYYRKTAEEYRVKEKSFNNVSMKNLNFQKVTKTDIQIFNMLSINNKIQNENFKKINYLNEKDILTKVNIQTNYEDKDNILDNLITLRSENGKSININFKHDISINQSENWIDIIQDEENNIYNIKIYLEHPFFKPYVSEEDFLLLLKRFIVALVASVIQSKYINYYKEIDPIQIFEIMNLYLKNINSIVNE